MLRNSKVEGSLCRPAKSTRSISVSVLFHTLMMQIMATWGVC